MAVSALQERLFASVMPVPEAGCWIWMKAMRWDGYGKATHQGCRGIGAHRWAWEVVNGPIPKGLNVLHRCDVKSCVNPDHLFLGTQKENLADCRAKGRWHGKNQNSAKTHCVRGHPLSGDNLYLHGLRRHCRTCRADDDRHRKSLRRKA